MVQPTSVTWADLSPGAQDSLAWARAVEVEAPNVGTRGLMLGMLRSSENPAEVLMQYLGLRDDQLLFELRRQVPDKRLLEDVADVPELSGIPGLTTNAAACLTRASELQREATRPLLDVGCLLAALLETRAATARAAIRALIGEQPLRDIGEATREWLRNDSLTYPQTLQQRLQHLSPGSASNQRRVRKEARTWLREPWPYLAVFRRHEASEDRAGLRSVGLGFLRSADTLVTAGRVVTIADAPAFLPETDTEHEFPRDVSDTLVAVLGLTSPAPWTTLHSFPPIVAARDGQRCVVVTVDEHSPVIAAVAGVVVSEGSSDDPLFTIKLDAPLSENTTSMGSPVVDTDGAIIGLVSTSATHRLVSAYGHTTLVRMLGHDAGPAPSGIATGTLTGAGNDRVGDDDQLGFTSYVDAFADLITSPHTQPPLTIGIFGSWGMGKSFLLEHIQREIERRQAADRHAVPQVHVVRFNAWEYSSMDVVWPALVRMIVSRLDKLSTWPVHRRLWTRVRWNIARQWRQLWPRLIAGAIVVVALIVAAAMNGEDNVAKAIGGVAAALGIAGVLKAAKDPVANWVTTLFADSDYGDQLQVMKDIKHDLTTLEERLHEHGDPDQPVTGRILILIDDLDRCEPAKAVEVLQALNLLLNFNSFVVALGIDARIVTGAIEKHYEGLLGKAGASGYEYLDKIVQIPFRIPEPGRDEIISFVTGQLGNPPKPPPPAWGAETGTPTPESEAAPPGNGRVPPDDEPAAHKPLERERIGSAWQRVPEFEQLLPQLDEVPFTYAELEAFKVLAERLRPNPRHLKRLVNVYRLVRALARAQNEPLILQRPMATIRWLVMWSQWPYASLAMIERYEALVDEHGDDLSQRVAAEDPLLHLFEAVNAGLDAKWIARLDDSHDDLRKLLAIRGCGLSWDEIRRIRRFTVNFNPAVEEQLRQPAAPAPTDSGTA